MKHASILNHESDLIDTSLLYLSAVTDSRAATSGILSGILLYRNAWCKASMAGKYMLVHPPNLLLTELILSLIYIQFDINNNMIDNCNILYMSSAT